MNTTNEQDRGSAKSVILAWGLVGAVALGIPFATVKLYPVQSKALLLTLKQQIGLASAGAQESVAGQLGSDEFKFASNPYGVSDVRLSATIHDDEVAEARALKIAQAEALAEAASNAAAHDTSAQPAKAVASANLPAPQVPQLGVAPATSQQTTRSAAAATPSLNEVNPRQGVADVRGAAPAAPKAAAEEYPAPVSSSLGIPPAVPAAAATAPGLLAGLPVALAPQAGDVKRPSPDMAASEALAESAKKAANQLVQSKVDFARFGGTWTGTVDGIEGARLSVAVLQDGRLAGTLMLAAPARQIKVAGKMASAYGDIELSGQGKVPAAMNWSAVGRLGASAGSGEWRQSGADKMASSGVWVLRRDLSAMEQARERAAREYSKQR